MGSKQGCEIAVSGRPRQIPHEDKRASGIVQVRTINAHDQLPAGSVEKRLRCEIDVSIR